MKLKESLTQEYLDDIAGVIDNEGIGYMMFFGGLEPCQPKQVLDNEDDIKKVNEAIKIVQEFVYILPML